MVRRNFEKIQQRPWPWRNYFPDPSDTRVNSSYRETFQETIIPAKDVHTGSVSGLTVATRLTTLPTMTSKADTDTTTSTFDPTKTVTQSLPPSHIGANGEFVFLPPPTERERQAFFERSIALYGLLQQQQDDDDNTAKRPSDKEEDGGDQLLSGTEGPSPAAKKPKKKDTTNRVHPLAMASARLQHDGIAELNRAINLQTLVNTNEYFTMTNIVDRTLATTTTADTNKTTTNNNDNSKQREGGKDDTEASKGTVNTNNSTPKTTTDNYQLLQDQKVRALYVLQHKRWQFSKASTVLERHLHRLTAAIVTTQIPDQRYRELRRTWRIVAPEHGTRALPHATRPTEVIAFDVDAYTNTTATSLGRLARRVPRYATIEIQSTYSETTDVEEWNKRHETMIAKEERKRKKQTKQNKDDMDLDGGDEEDEEEDEKQSGPKSKDADGDETMENVERKGAETERKSAKRKLWTEAEPFAIADPTLGKLDADFDPKKVPMLSLQFDIEKSSTGVCQSAVLEPVSLSDGKNDGDADEKVLVALQHSLFCAKLFESIRRELAPDTEDVGNIRTSAEAQSIVWLSDESDTNFLPNPSLMSGKRTAGLLPLCVIHCHEGEVKVQLDCEHTLQIKLVEAGQAKSTSGVVNSGTQNGTTAKSIAERHVMAVCNALLLHAQERYHQHSVEAAEKIQKQEEEDKLRPDTHLRKKDPIPSPRILQSCVSLGSKMLFENRIRTTLRKMNQWLKERVGDSGERMHVEWLSLSTFDLNAYFTLTFRSWVADAHLTAEELTITSMSKDGDFRKVKFHSDDELELYLMLTLQRALLRS